MKCERISTMQIQVKVLHSYVHRFSCLSYASLDDLASCTMVCIRYRGRNSLGSSEWCRLRRAFFREKATCGDTKALRTVLLWRNVWTSLLIGDTMPWITLEATSLIASNWLLVMFMSAIFRSWTEASFRYSKNCNRLYTRECSIFFWVVRKAPLFLRPPCVEFKFD